MDKNPEQTDLHEQLCDELSDCAQHFAGVIQSNAPSHLPKVHVAVVIYEAGNPGKEMVVGGGFTDDSPPRMQAVMSAVAATLGGAKVQKHEADA